MPPDQRHTAAGGWQDPVTRVRHLQRVQLLVMLAAAAAAVLVGVHLGRALLQNGEARAGEAAREAGVVELRNQLRTLEARYWEARARGGSGVPASVLAGFASGAARAERLIAEADGVIDGDERAARADAAGAIGDLRPLIIALARPAPGGGADERLVERARAVVERLDAALDRWAAANGRQAAALRARAQATTRRLVVWQVALLAAFAGLAVLLHLLIMRTRERIVRRVRDSERRFRLLVQRSSDAVIVVDADGRILYGSESLAGLIGQPLEALPGRPVTDLAMPDDARLLAAAREAATGSPATVEWRTRSRTPRTVETIVTDLRHEPAVAGYVLNCRDVSDRAALEERLKHQAFHDELTGLPNRTLFEQRLGAALDEGRRSRSRVAVLMLDLDDFKLINDSWGHSAGDTVLVGVAARLRGCLREHDTVARIGGDEFAVLLDRAGDGGRAAAVVRRIEAAFASPLAAGARMARVHASVGVALSDPDAEAPENLLRDADTAMYVAKSRGRGRAEWFATRMHDAVAAHLSLRAELERALAEGRFALQFQPIVRLADGRPAGAEALLRWEHPTRGRLAPGEFIDIAEDTGLIVPIGDWALREACRQMAAWHDASGNRSLRISVNVSARQLDEPGFVDSVRRALADSGLDPEHLVLEITESALLADDGAAEGRLAALSAIGVRLAIDDFGTGYSSLSYLGRLPVDILKVDRSFVGALGATGRQAALAGVVAQVAGGLGLVTVAEGVETACQHAALRVLGCPYGQGHLFGRPLDPDAFGALLAQGALSEV